MTHTAGHQTQTDDPVTNDHHGRKHRVTGQGAGALAARQHHRDDQGHLDHCHRYRQHQRAQRFADTMSDYFGVMDGHQNSGNQHRRHQCDQ